MSLLDDKAPARRFSSRMTSRTPINQVLAGLFWLALYLVLVLSPLLLMSLPPVPPARGFWSELSVVLGLVGLVQIGLQFALIARFRPVTEPYGIDVILQYHRQIGLASLALILAHAVVAVVARPALAPLLLAPWRAGRALAAGVGATLAFLALVGLSFGRRRLRLGYEAWRVTHAFLGIALLGLAMVHVWHTGAWVNAPWKRAVWIAFLALMVGVIGWLRVLQPIAQTRRPYRVVDVEPDRGDTWVLAVEPEGHQGLRFLPGQFVWLKLGDSAFTLQEHPFSFSSSAEEPGRLEFGIKELGDFTRAIGEVAPGTRAWLDGPHGSLSIDRHPAAGYVFIAGGIGVTPIVSMLRTMADRDDRRPALLVYADDSWERMPFRDDIRALEERMALEVVHVVEEAHQGWEGEVGLVTPQLLDRCLPDGRIERDYFVCGPNPMIDAVESALLARGVSSWRIHAERFNLV